MIRSRTLGENRISAHGFPGSDGCVHTHPVVDVWNRGHRDVGVRSFTEISHKRPEVRCGVEIAIASAMDRQERFRQRPQCLPGIGKGLGPAERRRLHRLRGRGETPIGA